MICAQHISTFSELQHSVGWTDALNLHMPFPWPVQCWLSVTLDYNTVKWEIKITDTSEIHETITIYNYSFFYNIYCDKKPLTLGQLVHALLDHSFCLYYFTSFQRKYETSNDLVPTKTNVSGFIHFAGRALRSVYTKSLWLPKCLWLLLRS